MIATILALTLTLQAPAAPPAQATVSGQLQTSDPGRAAGIRVSAIPAPPPYILPTDGQNYYAVQATAASVLTGEGGTFRLTNLRPGRYYLLAGMIGEATFYPGTLDIQEAEVVTVAAGETVGDLAFKLVTPPGTRLEGTVTPPSPSGTAREIAVLSGLRLGELLEVPVRPDGTFEFGRLPSGDYILNIFPTPPGLPTMKFTLTGEDRRIVQFRRPDVVTVTGRLAATSGPVPTALLAFTTEQSHVSGTINPDGTFTTRLHAANHRVELAGMPVGYSLQSVSVGGRDVASGFTVGNTDVRDVVITVAAPMPLPAIRGRVEGLTDQQLATVRVRLAGPIVGTLEAPLAKDGSFEFPAVPRGGYIVDVPQVPQLFSARIVVDVGGAFVRLVLPPQR